MLFSVDITLNARGDLRYFRAYEQRIITNGIRTYLATEADTETNNANNSNRMTSLPGNYVLTTIGSFMILKK